MRRKIGSRVIRWLVVAAMCAMSVQSFAGNVGTNDLIDGAVTTPKIADGAVTAAKLGIVCPDGQYLKYTAGSGWACNVGTPGLQGVKGDTGPQGQPGEQGMKGDTGAQGPAGPMPHYSNVIVVAKSGGDFSDISAALASISDASADNPYLIRIMPGLYTITSQIRMKPFVDVKGSGEGNTKLTGAYDGLVSGASNSELSNLTIENNGNNAFINYNISGAKFSNVAIVDINGNFGMYNWNSNVELQNVKINVITDTIGGSAWGIRNYNHSKAIIKNVSIVMSPMNVSSGYNTGIENTWSSADISSSSITLSNMSGSYGIINQTGDTKIRNSSITATTAIYNDVTGQLLVNNSEVDGTVSGTIKCISSFDASYNQICQ